jgi:hypothetical protein
VEGGEEEEAEAEEEGGEAVEAASGVVEAEALMEPDAEEEEEVEAEGLEVDATERSRPDVGTAKLYTPQHNPSSVSGKQTNPKKEERD